MRSAQKGHMKRNHPVDVLMRPVLTILEGRMEQMLELVYDLGAKTEREKCIAEVEAFAKIYAEKGIDEVDQKAQAWAISQAASELQKGLSA